MLCSPSGIMELVRELFVQLLCKVSNVLETKTSLLNFRLLLCYMPHFSSIFCISRGREHLSMMTGADNLLEE
jgi:hypothetical protein